MSVRRGCGFFRKGKPAFGVKVTTNEDCFQHMVEGEISREGSGRKREQEKVKTEIIADAGIPAVSPTAGGRKVRSGAKKTARGT